MSAAARLRVWAYPIRGIQGTDTNPARTLPAAQPRALQRGSDKSCPTRHPHVAYAHATTPTLTATTGRNGATANPRPTTTNRGTVGGMWRSRTGGRRYYSRRCWGVGTVRTATRPSRMSPVFRDTVRVLRGVTGV